MLATFVIGLREGLEAALIVGIVAAFLRQRGGTLALRWVWIGVSAALAICLTVGVVLQVVSANLPQRQQEALETVIGAVAVAMVTYMVIWMRRHARDLKGQLEGVAGTALAQGSARALVAMAFLAVLREGLETAVFLLAAFNASGNGLTAGIGASFGVLVASLLGYGIYRGGVRINLSRFFRATGVVLVLVAAGLVMTALHTAHEAGWLNSGHDQLLDISWLVRNGSVQASLITGVLGIQSRPTEVEVIGWLLYLVPVGLYVGWPPGRRVPWRSVTWVASVLAVGCAAAAAASAVAAPARPDRAAQGTWVSPVSGTTVSRVDATGFASSHQQPVSGSVAWSATGTSLTDTDRRAGIDTDRRAGIDTAVQERVHTEPVTGDEQLPSRVTLDQLRALNGGRLPLGLPAADISGRIAISYQQQVANTVWRDPSTDRILDGSRRTVVVATAQLSSGPLVLGNVRTTDVRATASARAAAAAGDRELRATDARATTWGSDYPTLLGVAAAGLAIGARFAGLRHHARVTPEAILLAPAPTDEQAPGERLDVSPTTDSLPVR